MYRCIGIFNLSFVYNFKNDEFSYCPAIKIIPKAYLLVIMLLIQLILPNHMYKYVLSCLLVSIFALPGLGQGNTKQADFLKLKVKWRTYKKRDYKISYPKTWSLTKLRRKKVLLLSPKPEICQNSGLTTTINLVNYPLPDKKTGLEGVIKRWNDKYKEMDSVKILEQGYVQNGKLRYYKLVFIRDYEKVGKVKVEDRYYLKDGRYYVLDFNGSLAGFEEHRIRATQIMDSFMLQ